MYLRTRRAPGIEQRRIGEGEGGVLCHRDALTQRRHGAIGSQRGARDPRTRQSDERFDIDQGLQAVGRAIEIQPERGDKCRSGADGRPRAGIHQVVVVVRFGVRYVGHRYLLQLGAASLPDRAAFVASSFFV